MVIDLQIISKLELSERTLSDKKNVTADPALHRLKTGRSFIKLAQVLLSIIYPSAFSRDPSSCDASWQFVDKDEEVVGVGEIVVEMVKDLHFITFHHAC